MNRISIFSRLAPVFTFIGLACTSQAQIFVNGGFEAPLVTVNSWAVQPEGWGWNGQHNVGIANGNGSWGTGGHAGNQYAYIESDGIDFPGQQGWIEQTVSGFTIGDSYVVNFWMARRNGNVGGNTSNPVRVMLNGTDTLLGPALAPDPVWRNYVTSTFVATSTSNTIRFLTTPTGVDSANLFDDITIQAVPEPATLTILSIGVLALIRRKR